MNSFIEGFCQELEKVSFTQVVKGAPKIGAAGMKLFKTNPTSFQKIYGTQAFQALSKQTATPSVTRAVTLV